MTDHRRESSLLMGVTSTVLVATVLFFGVSRATQQLAQRKARWQELRSQLARVERQVAQQGVLPNPEQLRLEAEAIVQLFVTPETVEVVKAHLASAAEDHGVTVTVLPALAPEPPARPLPGFEGCYLAIPLVTTIEGRYRGVAAYLQQVTASVMPVVGVRSVMLTPHPDGGQRVKARAVFEMCQWVAGAVPKAPIPIPAVPEALRRDESARDPFDPRYLGEPEAEGIALGGILWDPQRPTCILNGMVVGIGEGLNGYTVVAIESNAVVLRGEREIVLTVSP